MPFANIQPDKLGMKKLHTVRDKIVLDALGATTYSSVPNAVNGGIAVQSYVTDPDFYRPTADVDLVVGKPLGFPDFRNAMQSAADYLKEMGYSIDMSKAHTTYNINMSGHNDTLCVQFKRKSGTHFERNKVSIEREVAYANEITKGDVHYKVLRAEDIILHKIARMYRTYEGGETLVSARELNSELWIPNHNILLHKNHVKILRKYAAQTMDDEDIAAYRIEADIFDINALLTYQKFDRKYFEEGLAHFESLQKHKRKILKNIDNLLER